MQNLLHRLQHLHGRHQRIFPISFFVLGFAFDAMFLDRIDTPFGIGQAILYLILTGALIAALVLERHGIYCPPEFLKKVWKYSEHAIHFLLGTLLNFFMLFYFKSASLVPSLIFLGILTAVLLINEFFRAGGGIAFIIQVGLWSLSLLSFFVLVTPILFGFIGPIPFLVAVLFSFVAALPFYWVLKKFIKSDSGLLGRQIRAPFLWVQLIFTTLYFFQMIPPVPLAIKKIGIYREVKRLDGKFLLTHARPWWKVWQSGEQDFIARPGDQVVCFAQIFSPTGFKDSLQVRWLLKGRDGWIEADAIPFEITGGSDEGYRAYTVKTNWVPGRWQVRIETTDKRELGRISLEILAAKPETALPAMTVDSF